MKVVLIWLALLLPYTVDAKIHRSGKARADFKRQNPCPADGSTKGKCSGWVIDHIVPLTCGGADAPKNMQWQTTADAKAKDRWERKNCLL